MENPAPAILMSPAPVKYWSRSDYGAMENIKINRVFDTQCSQGVDIEKWTRQDKWTRQGVFSLKKIKFSSSKWIKSSLNIQNHEKKHN